MVSLGISVWVQCVVVAGLAVLCVALARQVARLQQMIAPMGALALNRRLAGGDPAPTLSLQTLSGETLAIGSPPAEDRPQGCHLIFFLSPFCSVSRTLLPVLKSIRQRERRWLTVILASDGDDLDSHSRFIDRHQLAGFSYVVSEAFGRAYGIGRVPYAVLVDERGFVAGLGIVNSREHLESLLEARRLERPSLQAYLRAQEQDEES